VVFDAYCEPAEMLEGLCHGGPFVQEGVHIATKVHPTCVDVDQHFS